MSEKVKRPRQETLQNIRKIIDTCDDEEDADGDAFFQRIMFNNRRDDTAHDIDDDSGKGEKNEINSKSDDESFQSEALSSEAGRDSEVSSFTCSEGTESLSSGASEEKEYETKNRTNVSIKPRKGHVSVSNREGRRVGINKTSHTLGEIRMRKAPSVYTHKARMEMALNIIAVASTEALKQIEIDAQAAVSAVGTISDLMKFGKKRGRNAKKHLLTAMNNNNQQRNFNESSENDSDEDFTDQNGTVYPIYVEYDLPAYWKSDEVNSHDSRYSYQRQVPRLQSTIIGLERNDSLFPLRPYYFDP